MSVGVLRDWGVLRVVCSGDAAAVKKTMISLGNKSDRGEMLIEDNPDNSWNNSGQEMSSYDNPDNS